MANFRAARKTEFFNRIGQYSSLGLPGGLPKLAAHEWPLSVNGEVRFAFADIRILCGRYELSTLQEVRKRLAMRLMSELRRRNVLRMAALYAVAAWLIMQVAEVVMTLAVLRDWAGRLTLILLAIGFPIALALSWFYELTAEGLSLEREIEPGASITHKTGRDSWPVQSNRNGEF